MEAYQCIISRQSIRNYIPKPITKKIFTKLIRAASKAPSGANSQPWFFYVIRNKNIIEKMRRVIIKTNPNSDWAKKYGTFFNAPYVISVCLDMRWRWYHQSDPKIFKNEDDVFDNPDFFSVAAAIQNILLAAHAMKIGSCWCKINPSCRKKLEKVLKINKSYRLIANIAIGYYNQKDRAPTRKPLKDIFIFVD